MKFLLFMILLIGIGLPNHVFPMHQPTTFLEAIENDYLPIDFLLRVLTDLRNGPAVESQGSVCPSEIVKEATAILTELRVSIFINKFALRDTGNIPELDHFPDFAECLEGVCGIFTNSLGPSDMDENFPMAFEYFFNGQQGSCKVENLKSYLCEICFNASALPELIDHKRLEDVKRQEIEKYNNDIVMLAQEWEKRKAKNEMNKLIAMLIEDI